MTEFENLKNKYLTVIQAGIMLGANKQESKHGNELLHRFCEMLVDSSGYSYADKEQMKYELSSIKNKLDMEIEIIFRS